MLSLCLTAATAAQKNINDCLRNKVGFLFNMKCGVSGSLTQELIDEERLNLQDLNRRDWYTQVFQVTKKINWIYEPSPVKNQRSTKKDTGNRGALLAHLLRSTNC